MRLPPGEPAPIFTTKDCFNRPLALEDYRGKRLLLSFFRYASCVFCNLRVHLLIRHYPALHDRGLEMVAVFQSPPHSIRKYVGDHLPTSEIESWLLCFSA